MGPQRLGTPRGARAFPRDLRAQFGARALRGAHLQLPDPPAEPSAGLLGFGRLSSLLPALLPEVHNSSSVCVCGVCLRGLGELLLPGLRGPAVGPSGARLGHGLRGRGAGGRRGEVRLALRVVLQSLAGAAVLVLLPGGVLQAQRLRTGVDGWSRAVLLRESLHGRRKLERRHVLSDGSASRVAGAVQLRFALRAAVPGGACAGDSSKAGHLPGDHLPRGELVPHHFERRPLPVLGLDSALHP
mmetsp:Transcript_51166/g.122551  ORF Transcript_51166/g.122551 Transcript_51166/m.122551 type:complete len:243 (-) Transcript_51166:389-1117(-)